jgi:hypothetical protein
MVKINYETCKECGRYASYVLYDAKDSRYICAWCAHARIPRSGCPTSMTTS